MLPLVNHSPVIYVPQGRCGRIDSTGCNTRMGSLFTDGTGSCQIVPMIGKGRVSLFHIDSVLNLNSLESECEWVGAEATAVILFRKNYHVGDILRHTIITCLKKQKIKIQEAFINSDQDGVQLWAEPDGSRTLHPHLTVYGMHLKPDRLWRHPQEKYFTTVQKIEQFLAMGYETPLKRTVIFNGEYWQRIPQSEMVPYCATKIEKEHLDNLCKLKGGATKPLIHALYLIISEIQKRKGVILSDNPLSFAITVMEHVDNYISDYDYFGSFKRKMVESLADFSIYCQAKNYTLTQKDKEQVKKILAAFDLKNPYPVVKRLVEQYKQEGNFASNHLASEFCMYEGHYLSGLMYAQYAEGTIQGKKKAADLSKEGNAHFQKEEWSQALDCFEKAFFLAQEHYMEGEVNFPKFYINYGIALQKLDRKEEGDRMIQIGQDLKKQVK